MSEPISLTSQAIPILLHYEPSCTWRLDHWQPLLNEPLRSQAQEVAFFVANRMRDPDVVHTIAEHVGRERSYYSTWSASSLIGDCGVAMMYAYFDSCFPGQGWDDLARCYLRVAATETQRMAVSQPGMFSGASGMALALAIASREGKRYQKTLAQLHQGISQQVLEIVWRRPASDGGVAYGDYDLISGASGVLTYLISIAQPDALIQTAIAHLLAYLTWLAEPGQPLGRERWYIPAALLLENQRLHFPQGVFNCGLAHGVPGPLAALALTWLVGYRFPGLRESIAYLSEWVLQHQVRGEWGIDWPTAIPFETAFSPQAWQNLWPTRTAWCYGTPGVARSLWLAGQALQDQRLLQTAVEAIEMTLLRPVVARSILSPTLCHGVAGLLQICLRFAWETGSSLLKEHIPLLVEQILDTFNPDSAFGFCDLDETHPVDEPGWLTGAPGTAMTLLAASTSVLPTWDRALALA